MRLVRSKTMHDTHTINLKNCDADFVVQDEQGHPLQRGSRAQKGGVP